MIDHKYKKVLVILLFSLFIILIIIKYSISFFKNEILNIIKSDQFDTFIVNIFDQKLEKLANTNIPPQKKQFYKSNLEKILRKIEELN